MLREFFEKYQIGDATVAAGVSGGAISLALAFQLTPFASAGPAGIALTVDHGLRPESRDEAEYVAKLAAERQIEHHILTWEGKKPEKGIEEAARTARYGLLCGWCRDNGVGTLAVAHHLLDQAETFFMRLQRGSGLNGLCGMAPLSEKNGVRLIRPFLQVHPERLKEFLRERGVSWAEDPFNRCDDYLRVRVRKFCRSWRRRWTLRRSGLPTRCRFWRGAAIVWKNRQRNLLIVMSAGTKRPGFRFPVCNWPGCMRKSVFGCFAFC